jgi:hypothetical protein
LGEEENPGEESMAEKHNCEMFVVRYVPDVVRGEFVNLGVMLVEANGDGKARYADVRFTRDWKKLSCFAPELRREDVEMLEEAIRGNLQSETLGAWVHERNVSEREFLLRGFDESWSGALQVAPVKGLVTAQWAADELELLAKKYLSARGRVQKEAGGRQAIVRVMQQEFERQGVWELMRKKIAVTEYAPGDPLKIDCGYRPNGVVKMFHAVSMSTEPEVAKSLAISLPRLRRGLRDKEKAETELTAVVEDGLPENSELVRFVKTMLVESGIQVRALSDMPEAAERARLELRLQ